MKLSLTLLAASALQVLGGYRTISKDCPDYATYSSQRHQPYSSGRQQLSYMRPSKECRTFVSDAVESLITNVTASIRDPDLARLFENAFPNTLDTAIRWQGTTSDGSHEPLAFIITGDINAMWIRDSTNQMLSYKSLLANDIEIASLYRGVIRLQSRYLLTSPFCNSFQPPAESNIPPAHNAAAESDFVKPSYNASLVFECKYELDSLAAFFRLSSTYFNITRDVDFFRKGKWLEAAQAVMDTVKSMMGPTYGTDGYVMESPYTFTRMSRRSTETLANDGIGNPVSNEMGLIRSAFRPSDDSTIFQFNIPANMMYASGLEGCAKIMTELERAHVAPAGLAKEMAYLAKSLRTNIDAHGVIKITNGPGPMTEGGGKNETWTVYAYEMDGYGGVLLMDDANIPSLLSAPLFGYSTNGSDPLYGQTRAFLLNQISHQWQNSWFVQGPVISAIGSPHTGPGMAWPMSSIARIMTQVSDSPEYDDGQIVHLLKEIVRSTDGLGLIHESINTFNQSVWTRPWFSWANGLFGEMILDLYHRKPHILQKTFQKSLHDDAGDE